MFLIVEYLFQPLIVGTIYQNYFIEAILFIAHQARRVDSHSVAIQESFNGPILRP